jgi:auxin influx carrier (AUX1 LAX family)
VHAYCFYFLSDELPFSECNEQNAAEKPPFFLPSWTAMFMINAFIVVWVLVVGFGLGGWASMVNFVRQIDTFGLFAKCYQCPPHPSVASPLLPPSSMAPSPSMPFIFNMTGTLAPMSAPSPAPAPLHFVFPHHHHRHHRHGL